MRKEPLLDGDAANARARGDGFPHAGSAFGGRSSLLLGGSQNLLQLLYQHRLFTLPPASALLHHQSCFLAKLHSFYSLICLKLSRAPKTWSPKAALHDSACHCSLIPHSSQPISGKTVGALSGWPAGAWGRERACIEGTGRKAQHCRAAVPPPAMMEEAMGSGLPAGVLPPG